MKRIISLSAIIAGIIIINIAVQFCFFRLDLTSEKRYSISQNSKDLLKNLDESMTVTIYLDGDLNAGFLRLKKSTGEMLDEFKAYAGRKLSYSFVNPSAAASDKERMAQYGLLEQRGLRATLVYDKDSEGQQVQKVIFPWAQISTGRDTINVNLLKNIQGNSGAENLNISIENLEFELTDAIRIITTQHKPKLAFIEGQHELPEILTFDITHSLEKYFDVFRGALGNDPSILTPFKAIVIAKPREKFTESEKYIIDQYIMNGGRALWLVDGAQVSMDTLANYGMSPAIYNDVNLNDMLFRYGVRINPNVLMDVQCALIPVDKARAGDKPDYQPAAWYFSPLLLPAPAHPVTRNMAVVKSEFVSSIDLVGNNPDIEKEILLVTSQHSKSVPLPTRIGLEAINIPADPNIFNQQHLPVAVSLNGVFPSVFANRMPPKNIVASTPPKTKSVNTRMIVVANGDIIRNDVMGVGANAQPLPLGYDAYMKQEFGNKNFILNAILYLTDDDGWLSLRSRELKIRLLDKIAVTENKQLLQMANVLLPVVLLLAFAVVNVMLRKRKYAN